MRARSLAQLGLVAYERFNEARAAGKPGDIVADGADLSRFVRDGQRQRARAEYQKAINSKIDYRGAQAEAQKYLDQPYTKPSNVLG